MALLPYALKGLEGCVRHWEHWLSLERKTASASFPQELEQILFLHFLEDTEQKETARLLKMYTLPL